MIRCTDIQVAGILIDLLDAIEGQNLEGDAWHLFVAETLDAIAGEYESEADELPLTNVLGSRNLRARADLAGSLGERLVENVRVRRLVRRDR